MKSEAMPYLSTVDKFLLEKLNPIKTSVGIFFLQNLNIDFHFESLTQKNIKVNINF